MRGKKIEFNELKLLKVLDEIYFRYIDKVINIFSRICIRSFRKLAAIQSKLCDD